MKLSIVVCTTGNRRELNDCLESLAKQIHAETEIIVVNNSTTSMKINSKFKVINEPKIGLSHARNRGWQVAKGEYVAYIDDDAIADKNWIRNILNFISQHLYIEVFGGPFQRHSKSTLPNWMPAGYGERNDIFPSRKLTIGAEFLNGTNMIFKKKLLQKMHGFSPNFGMKGNKLHYGEETELQLRVARAGVEVWWEPTIQVSHLVHERKMHLLWLLKESFITGQATQQMMSDYSDVFGAAKKHAAQSKSIVVRGNLFQKITKLTQLLAYGLGRIYQLIIH